MQYVNYKCLKVDINKNVAFITIDNPPINLFDMALMLEVDRVGKEIESDDNVKVIVFQSADPEFFIAHADVKLIQAFSADSSPTPESLQFFSKLLDRFRTMPKVSIAKIEGRAKGGGSEFVLALDMKFAAIGKAVLAQPELAMGIIPGGGGTQRLPKLVGRGRACEIIFGCGDFDAEQAERYGYINRALPPDEIGAFVENLAYRIASFPAETIKLAKKAINISYLPIEKGLIEESQLFNQSAAVPEARRRMETFLKHGGQTREVELKLSIL
ncbi:MAG: enoyl-CoA hydratase/isomerase family protein [Desulfobacteraceae bacterium]|nr:enoyl-CoA hydratase/isomerase family protein [Desulfobacteraceae bacterium]MBC2758118.1 enoyl-CoA hydratase/isomerase family protein [Desulfobacteraceae bacterium]